MIKIISRFSFVVIAIVALNACSTKYDTVVPQTKTQLLSKTWKTTSATISPAILGVTNLLLGNPPCELDNIVRFNANGTFTEEEGATKCDPSDPQIIDSGTWKFTNNETKVEILYAGTNTPDVFTIAELTTTQLKHTSTEIFNGVTYTTTFVLTAQ